MKHQSNTIRLFYQNSALATVERGGQQNSLLRNADRPLAERTSPGTNDLLATDDKNSVLARRNGTGASGHAYTAYGYNPALAAARGLSGFNGEFFELDTACYLLGNGYRTYSPMLMRFHSPDSWSPFGRGGVNAYCYCAGDPVNSTDPSGHIRVYLPNGQVMLSKKNVAYEVSSWLRPPGFDKADHRKALIAAKLEKPRSVHAIDPVKEGRTHIHVFEVFRNPGTSIEKVHIQAMDLKAFKRNRAEIGALMRLHYEGNNAPALNYRDKAAALMNQNEQLANTGKALWIRSAPQKSPRDMQPADANAFSRQS